jgi:hypothetical protein
MTQLVIQQAEDWNSVEPLLRQYLRGLEKGADGHRIIRAIDHLIAELSNIEVEQRRLHRVLPKHQELVDQINTNLLELEKHIFLAKLSKK